MRKHKPIYLTIHHTATRQRLKRSTKRKLKNLQHFSQSNAKLADGRRKKRWADIPYHYYIAANGEIAEGRKEAFAGDTNTKYDPTGHIGVVLEGNFQKSQPTTAQTMALISLLAVLAERYSIPVEQISGHRHHARTACPGKHLLEEIPEIRRAVAARLASKP